MTVIGMLHYRADPRKVFKSYVFAATAKSEGVGFFYFTPGKVNIQEKRIKGKVLKNGEWVDMDMPFPDVIYNAGSPMTEKADEIHDHLSKHIPFTSHSIGDKISVYQRLKKGKKFAQYLIPTNVINNNAEFFEYTSRYSRVILKPTSGHKGMGVLFVEKIRNRYLLIDQDRNLELDRKEIDVFLSRQFSNQEYLIQPYIECKTKKGNAYDFRLHVQKNGRGEWVNSAVYVKIADSGSMITNLNSGGHTMYLDLFLKNQFGEYYFNVKRYLQRFSIALARHMDQLYDESLDELGIDVGLDSNQKIWIYEVNWRPGVAPAFNLEVDIPRNTIQYAIFLAKKQKSDTKIKI
ncbi:YheC/D like ATP-grasp [Seinonella peptonophila]|uniref:YheC/D like ATP-grasp n=1 Tax=Seinonella peptonophila TaxID=112248 RepID=A0A1M5ABS9_9BACL|nr:YheC/YheD family protein [Seinonella peptonophila]SHF27547.1 YheC/D like ATP-grasp [Seinonella peptonophila]